MALENPIGNPLEPQNRPQFTAEFNTLGPVDDSMIGGTAAASAIGIGTDFGSPHGPVADEADRIFSEWISLVAQRLVLEGVDADRARQSFPEVFGDE